MTDPEATSTTDGLRAVAVDPDAMGVVVDELVAQASATSEPSRRAQLLGRAGYLAGVLRELDRATTLLTEAHALAAELGQRRRTAVLRCRLADIQALAGAPDRAEADLTAVLADCDVAELRPLRHFVLQHRGKARAELGDLPGALDDLTAARAARVQLGDPALLASTDAAIDAVRRLARRRDA